MEGLASCALSTVRVATVPVVCSSPPSSSPSTCCFERLPYNIGAAGRTTRANSKLPSASRIGFPSSAWSKLRISSSSQAPSDTVQGEDEENEKESGQTQEPSKVSISLDKDISKAIRKTAGTFAPRSSTRSKNPAVQGTTLYTVFEVQGYLSMAIGGLLSYNLVFPSNEPDLWRLMGMWSIWMFTIPSLRARDCSSKEKDALNYLFVGIPLVNVLLPIFWKSFSAVWTADVIAFFAMYAWKLDWLSSDGPIDE